MGEGVLVLSETIDCLFEAVHGSLAGGVFWHGRSKRKGKLNQLLGKGISILSLLLILQLKEIKIIFMIVQ